MYLMYVDESGDSGMNNSPTRYFALAGIVVHELHWDRCFEEHLRFRRELRQNYGFRVRDEFHAAQLISRPGEYQSIKLHRRIEMIRRYADMLAGMKDQIDLISIIVDKQGRRQDFDAFEMAWKALIQRFSNTLQYHNFRGTPRDDSRQDYGVLICDNTDNKKLTELRRKMQRFNPIPHDPAHTNIGGGYRQLPLRSLVEDPHFKDSRHSYFVQSADLAAFLIYQSVSPNKHMRKRAGHRFFTRLRPVACVHASRTDRQMGIVRI